MHGGINGFSRWLIWLEVGPTNNNPEVIAKFYLDAVKQVGGLPRKIRSDDGTENSMVEAIHAFFRSSHSDEDAGVGCFLIGRLTANQLHLVKDGPGWWIIFFKDLSARPDCMFFLPRMYSTDDFKVSVGEDVHLIMVKNLKNLLKLS